MKLVFAGDLCISSQAAPKVGESLAARLASADLVCANFEAPLIPPVASAASKAGPTISQSEAVLQFLEDCHVTHLALANNHIMDYGSTGLEYTLDKLRHLQTFGAALTNEEAYRPLFYEQDGKKIALLAFGEAQFGALLTGYAQQTGFAWIDSPSARSAVLRAHQQADWVIIQVHAGLEMVDIPLPEWRDRYREFIDLGADLVVGHHPHVTQGCEDYKGKQIYYSLGNFFMHPMVEDLNPGSGGVLEVVIENSQLRSTLIPIKVDPQNIDLDESYLATQHYRSLCSRLSAEEQYLTEIDQICESYWTDVYSRYYEYALTGLGTRPTVRAVVRVGKAILGFLIRRRFHVEPRNLMLIHNIRIETHRWTAERALGKGSADT